MANQKPNSKNRYHIALTVESRSEINKKIPTFEITPQQRLVAIALLKEIGSNKISRFIKNKATSKPPAQIIISNPNASTNVLAKLFTEANEKDRIFNGLVEIAKQKLVFSNIVPKELANEGNIKLGNEIISIRQFLYLVRDALGNRTTSGEDGSVGRAINQRGGVFYEFFIPLFSEVQQAEKKAAIENLTQYLTSKGRQKEIESALKNLEAHYAGPKDIKLPDNVHPENLTLDQQLELVNHLFNVVGRITPDIYVFRDTELRASGKEVSDYFSGLMIKSGKDSVTIMPNAIGESKFESVTAGLIDQIIKSVFRISKLQISSEFILGAKKVDVVWGKTVVTILQSEVDPPAAKFEDFKEQIKKASGSKQLKIIPTLKLTKTEEATTARKIIKIFVDLAKEFKAQEDLLNKTKPPKK